MPWASQPRPQSSHSYHKHPASQSLPPSSKSPRDHPGRPSPITRPLSSLAIALGLPALSPVLPFLSQAPSIPVPPPSSKSPRDHPGRPSPIARPLSSLAIALGLPAPSHSPHKHPASPVVRVPLRSPRASQCPPPTAHSLRDCSRRPGPLPCAPSSVLRPPIPIASPQSTPPTSHFPHDPPGRPNRLSHSPIPLAILPSVLIPPLSSQSGPPRASQSPVGPGTLTAPAQSWRHLVRSQRRPPCHPTPYRHLVPLPTGPDALPPFQLAPDGLLSLLHLPTISSHLPSHPTLSACSRHPPQRMGTAF